MSLIKIEEQDYEGNVYHKTTSADIVIAKDTGGLAGTVGENSNVQTLLDKLTDRVVNKLIEKGLIVDNFATQIKGFIPDATLITNLKKQLDEQNNNINGVLNAKIRASNVDDIFTGGCYDINPSTQGTLPEVNGYALLFVRTANTSWIYQDLIYTDAINFKHYHRMNINYAGWTEWEKYTSNSDLKPQIKSYSTNYGLNVKKVKTLTNLNLEISGRPNTSINSDWVVLCNVEETTLSTINYVFFTADNGVRYLCYVDNKGNLYFKPFSNILATDFIYCTMTYII